MFKQESKNEMKQEIPQSSEKVKTYKNEKVSRRAIATLVLGIAALITGPLTLEFSYFIVMIAMFLRLFPTWLSIFFLGFLPYIFFVIITFRSGINELVSIKKGKNSKKGIKFVIIGIVLGVLGGILGFLRLNYQISRYGLF